MRSMGKCQICLCIIKLKHQSSYERLLILSPFQDFVPLSAVNISFKLDSFIMIDQILEFPLFGSFARLES